MYPVNISDPETVSWCGKVVSSLSLLVSGMFKVVTTSSNVAGPAWSEGRHPSSCRQREKARLRYACLCCSRVRQTETGARSRPSPRCWCHVVVTRLSGPETQCASWTRWSPTKMRWVNCQGDKLLYLTNCSIIFDILIVYLEIRKRGYIWVNLN